MGKPAKHVKVEEIARALSCSRETIRRLCREGALEGAAVKVRTGWRIDPEEAMRRLSQRD